MFENSKRYLPWSGRRYLVSQCGKVINSDGEIIEQTYLNDEAYVHLEWVLGKRDYLVSLLILIGFDKLKLPEHLLSEVEVLYIDNNKSNLAPVNLLYRYKCGPLPVENYPGYYYIPFYNDYAISQGGEIININTGKQKVWSITKLGGIKNQTGGYAYQRVLNDEGFSKTLFLHRALCYVFKPYDRNVMSLVNNHKDGNPSNNKIENLEWATYSQNNQHAYDIGLRPNAAITILMKDLKTGLIKQFSSITACANYLGNPRGDFIRWRLINQPKRIYSDMLLFKYNNDEPWPEIDLAKAKIHRAGTANDIVARNVFTGDLIIFSGTLKGSEITGVKSATILCHAREESVIPVNGYNFRYLSDDIVWPIHTERHLKIYEKYPIYPPDGVICFDRTTNKEIFYTSFAEAAKSFSVGKATFRKIVQKNLLLSNRYIFKYFKLRESLGPAIE